MTDRIRQIRVATQALSPVEAELLVSVEVEQPGDLKMRGRLVGPTCPYSTTIEIAYPLRMLPSEKEDRTLRGRVVIPEPSWWDPTSPFLYRGQIELWQRGILLESGTVRHGLRVAKLKSEGLLWNGKRLLLRAVDRLNLRTAELPELRQRGANALVLPPNSAGLVEAAERLGFVILARVGEPVRIEESVMNSPALLALLLPENHKQREDDWAQWKSAISTTSCFFGVDLAELGIHLGSDASGTVARLLRNADGELGRIM